MTTTMILHTVSIRRFRTGAKWKLTLPASNSPRLIAGLYRDLRHGGLDANRARTTVILFANACLAEGLKLIMPADAAR